METLKNEFVVNRPVAQAWAVLTDVERIAPCLPGAQLQEIDGDVYRGVVKVKLGPISTAFKGQAVFVERDDDAHRAVLKGEGRDTGGKGNADALITAQLEAIDATSTKCVVTTELRITGKVAQFGRGIMGDISAKLMSQFADNLDAMLAAEPDVAPDAAPAAEAAPAPATDEPRIVQGPEAAPLELGSLAGGAVAKRLIPLVAAVAAIVVAAVLIFG